MYGNAIKVQTTKNKNSNADTKSALRLSHQAGAIASDTA